MKLKNQTITVLLSIICIVFSSCNKDMVDIGSSVLPPGDKILFSSLVENLSSTTQIIDSIYIKQDSLLLGAFYDHTFGTAIADIITQLMPPINFVFPEVGSGDPPFEECEIDSAKLMIAYSSWVGDANSLMRVRAYELTGTNLIFNGKYPSNINVSDYCDRSKPLADAVFTPVKGNLGKDSLNYLAIPLSQEFVQRFDPRFAGGENLIYGSIDNFQQFFKGLYITTDFGSTAMLNVSLISINYYYHYRRVGGELVNLVLTFPSNSEVVRINHIIHPDRQLVTIPDTVTYISSPANFYTQIKIPLNNIYQQMSEQIGKNKQILISTVYLNILSENVSDSYLKVPPYMLAIKSASMQSFFDQKRLPSSNDTCATFTQALRQISTDNDTTYSFRFELSRMFATEFENYQKAGMPLADTLQLTILPVALSLTSTNYGTAISSATHYLPLCGLALRNEKSSKPVSLKIIYNGY
ncbi:MAG: DUF4270 domain-containing protein [Paludibacter sp.]|nr:DUF4270 domain-containing protein [Paludibacter sp.]